MHSYVTFKLVPTAIEGIGILFMEDPKNTKSILRMALECRVAVTDAEITKLFIASGLPPLDGIVGRTAKLERLARHACEGHEEATQLILQVYAAERTDPEQWEVDE